MNMILKTSIFVFLIFAAKASEREFDFDSNSDSKIDHHLEYDNGLLTRRLSDRNFDGKFDYTYTRKNNQIVITEDNDFDNTLDSETHIVILENGFQLISKYKLIKGKKKLVASFKNNITQKNDCSYEDLNLHIASVEKLVSNFNPVLTKVDNGFTSIVPGVRIHESCFDNFSKKSFTQMTTNALEIGLSCLKDLAKSKPDEAIKSELSSLLQFFDIQLSGKNKDVQILCHEKKYDWSDSTIAHASTDRTHPSGLPEIDHPFVSINPKIKTSIFGAIINGPNSKKEMEGIIFHEMIHNFGYTHGNGIEITYGCETCCFSDKKDATEYACNLCKGNYISDQDPKYLRDLALYSKYASFAVGEIFLFRNILNIKNSQENTDSIFTLLAPRGLGVQKALLEELQNRNMKVSNSDDFKEDINEASRFYERNAFLAGQNRIFVRAILDLYIDKDISKASEHLKEINSKQILSLENSHDRSAFEAAKLSRGLNYLSDSILNISTNKKERSVFSIIKRFHENS